MTGAQAKKGRGGSRSPGRAPLLLAALAAAACGGRAGAAGPTPEAPATSVAPAALRTLAEARGIRVGAAVGRVFGSGTDEADRYERVLAREFDLLTPENDLKFQRLRPAPGVFAFRRADSLLAFAGAHDMRVRGHTLVWHRQLAPWLTDGSWTPEEALAEMTAHITAVVGRYAGRISAWDVVNEAVDADGTLRSSFWMDHVGPDYLEAAFRTARAADPDALLFYNDFGAEALNTKSDSIHARLAELLRRGVPVDGVGMQAHFTLGRLPSEESMEANFARFAALGLELHITELDVRIPLPVTPEKLAQQAEDYGRVVRVCLRQPACRAIVFWGFTDADSWIPTTYPGFGAALPFDADYAPKPAYRAVRALLRAR